MSLLHFRRAAEGYCWSRTSERQVLRIRHLYLQAILRQEVGFFDSQEATTSEVINSISKDASLIQEVLSEKVARCAPWRHQPLPNFHHINRQNSVKTKLSKPSVVRDTKKKGMATGLVPVALVK